MTDQYFTPDDIATEITSELDLTHVLSAADFAIGDGSLIKSLKIMPTEVIGIDLDPTVIKRLKRNYPKWKLINADFLEQEPAILLELENWINKVDLILLNPPFSCKGGKYMTVTLGQHEFKCRTALAFVIKSLRFLAQTGKLLAILPLSTLKSSSDLKIIDEIHKYYNVSFGKRFDSNSFAGCSPKSVLMTITNRSSERQVKSHTYSVQRYKMSISMLRGAFQMHKTKSSGIYPVLHTTDIKSGIYSEPKKFADASSRYVLGEVLLIGRVGLPDKRKVLIVNLPTRHVLSDCLIGIAATNYTELTYVKDLIIDNWDDFSKLYDSTCAPYITIDQLETFLRQHFIHSRVVQQISSLIGVVENCTSSQDCVSLVC